jgi:hypothetical protein
LDLFLKHEQKIKDRWSRAVARIARMPPLFGGSSWPWR